ncbi:protein lin-9 homolog [Strongylocentrotus purpuratus]|uniref:DIRP domain-containing protein n=1 Tax=Strongylocentrotus purpuratus TaxID=7668 RepID=A0A7M7P1T3_STRPU|nr:protein lin-9 homolog [Strongylocentrotus purpuratus]
MSPIRASPSKKLKMSPSRTPTKLHISTSTLVSSPRASASKSPSHNPSPVSTPSKLPTSSGTGGGHVSYKKSAQKLGQRLKNLLKLPKAYKWCIYEWFYSNIDKSLFEGENDFKICLRESFPQLKQRKLTKVEWCIVRRLMGKPRRCSPAFFEEERAALEERRQKLRMLQHRKGQELDLAEVKDLPEEIPIPLCIGTKVTARLRAPHDGLFTGQIDALDPVDATYRVTFDRPNFGTHSVPDTEVLSTEEQETVALTSFLQKQRPRPNYFTPLRPGPGGMLSPGLEHDPMLGLSPLREKLQGGEGHTLGGFPVSFLINVTKLSKILGYKKELIQQMKEMNTEAERMKSLGQSYSEDFQQRYAVNVLEVDRLNTDLNKYLMGVQKYCQEIAPEQGLPPLTQPSEEKMRCEQEATQMVNDANLVLGDRSIKSPQLNDLIASLTSLMLQIKSLAKGDMNSVGYSSLNESIADLKKKIHPSNHECFENNVEVHIAHIQSGMSQMGNLHAFSERHVPY